MLPERIPIPESLHSIETGDPIATCLACDAPLLDGPTEYLVEKGYRQYEAYDVQETVPIRSESEIDAPVFPFALEHRPRIWM